MEKATEELKSQIYLYAEESKPFLKILLDYLNLHTGKIVLHNGRIEYQYPNEFWDLKRQVDEYLAVLQMEIFGRTF